MSEKVIVAMFEIPKDNWLSIADFKTVKQLVDFLNTYKSLDDVLLDVEILDKEIVENMKRDLKL